MMKFSVIVPMLLLALLFYSCKATKNQKVSDTDFNEYIDEFDQSEENRIVGEVIDIEPSGNGAWYSMRIVSNAEDTMAFSAPSDAAKFSSLEGKLVTVSYAENTTHVVYDMRIANDEFQNSLHEISTNNAPGMTDTYSIIGRYVYAEPRDTGMYLEIEGRYGTIYELTTEVTRSEWADEEVECAIHVLVSREAFKIEIKE